MTELLPIKRIVTYCNKEGQRYCELTDEGDGSIRLTLFRVNEQTEIGFIRCPRNKLLDLFVSLWPEEIAYQFKDTQDG